jgi:asparagine synthetase B (glutamine-hydrolysing)
MPEGKPNKALLRSAFREHLREDLLSRPKMGFTLPITRWLAGPMRDFAESSVDALRSSGLFRREAIDAIWSRFLAEPRSHVGSRALSLVVLGHYIERSRSIWGAADSHARVASSPTPVRVACG